MSYKKILLLSGPAKCGKGTLIKASLPYDSWPDMSTYVEDASCKIHLYKLVQDFFLVSKERFWQIYNDRELKEKPMPEFGVTLSREDMKALGKIVGVAGYDLVGGPISGPHRVNLSIRSAMIYLSEVVVKSRLGFNYFGRARTQFIEDYMAHMYQPKRSFLFYDDSSASFNGRSDELVGLVDYFGEDNILLINIRGRGKFGVGDSRGYHADGTVKHTMDLWNTGTEKEFLDKGCKIIQDFIGG